MFQVLLFNAVVWWLSARGVEKSGMLLLQESKLETDTELSKFLVWKHEQKLKLARNMKVFATLSVLVGGVFLAMLFAPSGGF